MGVNIQEATDKLRQYIETQRYFGYDPYDALRSPLFRLPVLRSSHVLRFAAQQAVKRSPINLRPILFISKGYNPVTLGLCIQAYTELMQVHPSPDLEERTGSLLSELVRLIPSGFHGACWGYDFDWAARHTSIPAYQPTVVATGIITNALYRLHEFNGTAEAARLCRSACDFILNDLRRTVDPDDAECYSYSPFDRQCVFNASMKAVRTLAQAYRLTGEEDLKKAARNAAAYVVKRQEANGAWKYSMAASGSRIDNYHTGYVLDCLHEYMDCTGDSSFSDNLQRGWNYYRNNFFAGNGLPKFRDSSVYPVDSTAAAQSLLTLCRFGDTDMALQVADWMIGHMQHADGSFYFRRYKYRTSKTPFMRWSNAWMFAGLATLLRRLKS